VDRFKVVVLDFTEVDTIGQAFADEIFRVFVTAHPAVEIVPVFTGPEVSRMIARARAAAASPTSADPQASPG
jgi:anti-anti-sigma regulatory factor